MQTRTAADGPPHGGPDVSPRAATGAPDPSRRPRQERLPH